MSFEIPFYILFASQILLVSGIYPLMLVRRIAYVFKTYPPATYPKLYAGMKPSAALNAIRPRVRMFVLLNCVTALIGGLLYALFWLRAILPWAQGKEEGLIVLYFLIQMVPFIMLERTELRHYKLMRLDQASTTREAELQPRRLFNFVSPAYVALAGILLCIWLAYFIFAQSLEVSWGWRHYLVLFLVILAQAVFAAVVWRHLYGKKIDPHQTDSDKQKQIGAVANGMVFSSIAASAFMITIQFVQGNDAVLLKATLMSGYFQILILFALGTILRTLNVKGIDFEAYRHDSGDKNPNVPPLTPKKAN